MLALFIKEINAFFSSLVGFLAIQVFLLITGLLLWVFPETSILEYGYATLEPFFMVAPWVFMFLIPAITMRSFSEEIQTGTIELLSTKPISEIGIILGKYFAALTLVIIALIPTLIYYYSVIQLGAVHGNIDSGGFWGSFIGLLFLGAAFVSIGIFASSISSNQIVSFILAIFLCFMFYLAFDFISALPVFYGSLDDFIQLVGINRHYEGMSKGVIDTRDVVYFLGLITGFIALTKMALESRKW